MRKSIILAGVLIAALVAVPAFASVQNVKISGSIDSTWLNRNNFDLGAGNTDGVARIEANNQSLFFTQTTLQVDADLTDQVSTTVGLINERQWDATQAADQDQVSLYLAYVTLREMLYSPLTVVVGRQVFSYGNSFVVDATGTNNAAPTASGILNVADDFTKQTSLDAIRLIFDYNPLTVEILYAKLDENTAGRSPDADRDDVDLYGINTTYELGDDMDTQVEAYFFSRINQAPNSLSADTTSSDKADTLYVPGLRASSNVLDGLNIQGEVAWQRGNKVNSTATQRSNERREAIAAQFIANYQVPALEEYNPVLNYTFTFVSGDSNPGDVATGAGLGLASEQSSTNVETAWDPFLEAQGGGTIYSAMFNLTNLQIHSVSLTTNPMEDVTTKVSWHGLWLDKQTDDSAGAPTTLDPDVGLNTVDLTGTTLTQTIQKGKTGLGHEIDWDTTYDYTEDVQIGASFGWFFPGNVFDKINDEIASQAIVHANVNF